MTSEGAGWKPRGWIAGLLSLFLFPFGFLYVARPWLVVVYLAISLVLLVGAAGLHAPISIQAILPVAVALTGMAHAVWLARKASPMPVRPWYTKWHGFVAGVAIFAFPIVLTRTFFFEPYNLPASSMAPGLPKGTNIWGQMKNSRQPKVGQTAFFI